LELQAKRALARLLEAHADMRAAKSLVRILQSRSLFHSQQCAEKALKACLSKAFIGDIKFHTVAKLLREKVIPTLPVDLQNAFAEIDNDAFWVEQRWIDTRYEEMGAEGKILTPIFRFNAVDAQRGIETAAKVLQWATLAVNAQFGLKLPKSYLKLKKLAESEFG
jgi:HEPN domain-containing protein